jgi:hypothetical protein
MSADPPLLDFEAYKLSMVLRTKLPNPPMVLRTKPPNPSDVDAYPTSTKLDVFVFLLDLTDAIYISHVDACLASARCHDAIVLLPDLVDVVFIIYVLLRLLMSQVSATAASPPASWSFSPSLTSSFTAPSPSARHVST